MDSDHYFNGRFKLETEPEVPFLPERAFLIAVLERALHDLDYLIIKDTYTIRSAYQWFRGETDGGISFQMVREEINLNPSRMEVINKAMRAAGEFLRRVDYERAFRNNHDIDREAFAKYHSHFFITKRRG